MVRQNRGPLVNVEEVMKTENAPCKNHQSGGEVSQELSKDSKAGGQRFKEMKGKCVGLEDSPPDQGVGRYKDSKLEKRRGH